jgi:hypothetical protein
VASTRTQTTTRFFCSRDSVHDEPKKKKSKREMKKAAFGSQKGMNITARADNYSAW